MKRKINISLITKILAVAVLLFLMQILYQAVTKNRMPIASTNKKAFDFNVLLLNNDLLKESYNSNGHFSLTDVKGKNIILNFWASWCGSCQDEAQDFVRFWQKYRTKDIVVIGIAVNDSTPKARALVQELKKNYPIGLDPDGAIALRYGITGVPETFFIDKSLTILHKVQGPMDIGMLEALSAKLF